MKLSDINLRDPFILPNGGKYYLYGSRGTRGFYVFVSRDLVEWSEPILCFSPPEGFWADRDFWAPEVHRYKDGYFYMFASFKKDGLCRGTQILRASSPLGPFSPISDGPVTPRDWECLDGTLYIDKAGRPYMVFCHEWVQTVDGEICAIELSDDLKRAVSPPRLLFKGSEMPGAPANAKRYVTDGPFMYTREDGRLFMLWSSFGENGYCEIVSRSDNGALDGKWIHSDKLMFKNDGGHGMLFKTFDGQLKFVCHYPNKGAKERPAIFDIDMNEW